MCGGARDVIGMPAATREGWRCKDGAIFSPVKLVRGG